MNGDDVMKLNITYNNDPRDYIFSLTDEQKSKIELPPDYNIVKELPPVLSQGTTNNCVGIVLTTIKFWQEKNEAKVDEKYDEEVGTFEPDFIYLLRDNINDTKNGMTFQNAFSILLKQGALPSKYYKRYQRELAMVQKPYYNIFRKSYEKKTSALLKMYQELSQQFCIKQYAQVKTLEMCKYAIKLYGMVCVGLNVYNTNTNFWKQQKGDVLRGGHAVLFVGYSDKEQCFILRNSWGDTYGIRGYSRFPYSDFGIQQCIYVCIDNDTDEHLVNTMDKAIKEKERRISSIVLQIQNKKKAK